MRFYIIAPTIRVHNEGYFTYQSEEQLSIGAIVMIPIGKKTTPGIVITEVKKPSFATKTILKQIVDTPLPLPLLETAKWLSDYYLSPVSAVWQTILPRGLNKKRRIKPNNPVAITRQKKLFTLNKAQQAAVTQIIKNQSNTTLLQGVTGSGKTAVYREVAKKVVAQNKSVIILVPEIALTSQLVAEFSHAFSDILVTHSQMTESERHRVWLACLQSETPRVVIGPRSALFLPLKKIGLIVVDECHESSFKQDQAPRYQATRVARILANHHTAHLVLGSATPLITDHYLASQKSQALVYLSSPAQKISEPDINIIDNKKRVGFSKHSFFSNKLLSAIDQALDQKSQVLLFHNRRGSAPYTLCENCGWTALCPSCHIPYSLHADVYKLVCHSCGKQQAVLTQCPDCHQTHIIHKGIGTKRIETELGKLYPRANIARFDGDNAKQDSLAQKYQAIYNGDIDIIVGTQVIAKGLDLPKLTVVGVIQADSGLMLPDFMSEERVFQLLSQTIGRVGRSQKKSTIIVQTYQPQHIAITTALQKDYQSFYEYCLSIRKQAHLPPFYFLLKATCVYTSEKSAQQAAKKIYSLLKMQAKPHVIVLPPTPAFYERIGATYRWQIIIKSPDRQALKKLAEYIPATKWQVDIDTQSLL